MPSAYRFCGLKAPSFIRDQVIEVHLVLGGRGEPKANPWRKTEEGDFGGGGGEPPPSLLVTLWRLKESPGGQGRLTHR